MFFLYFYATYIFTYLYFCAVSHRRMMILLSACVAICCAVLLGCVGPHVGPRALPAASSVGSPDSSRPRREYVPQLVELSPEVKALLGDGPPKKGRRG